MAKKTSKTLDGLRITIAGVPAGIPARKHLEQLMHDREAEEAARRKARDDAESLLPRYPWQSEADRAALLALAEHEAVAKQRFGQLPAVRALRNDAERGRKARADRRKGGLTRRRSDPTQIAKLAKQWRQSDELQENYRTENAYISAKTGLSVRTIQRARKSRQS